MSKSLGNDVDPQDLIPKYGADILRFWVASLDYRDDDPDLRGDPRALRPRRTARSATRRAT